MNIFKKNFSESVKDLPRFAKKIIAIICDISLSIICIVVAFYLRLEQFVPLRNIPTEAIWLSVCLVPSVFWIAGLYNTIFRYSGLAITFSTWIAVSIYGLIYFCIVSLYRIEGIPRSIGILQPMLLFFTVICSRLLIKYFFSINNKKNRTILKKILIYGAGSAGRQLSVSLENSFEFKVIGFLDDDKRLWGQSLYDLRIYNPNKLEELIESKGISIILLALPSVSRFKRNQILEKIKKYKLIVHTLPSVTDIVNGKLTLSDIKKLDVNDILNREIVEPKKELMIKNIKNQVVLVSGAGGSIGSEICRQIVKIEPKALILCEINEFALYKIYDDLKIINSKLKIIPLLLNIQNEDKLVQIIKIFKVETIYHAAAYKHVPLVESNICESVLNNVFGTYSIINAATKQHVSNFVLISSDKAVRPKNIMGATKRLSELCLQAFYDHHRDSGIKMSIVRFGNVLDSSGSVIPKFTKQIKYGGPITLTHPEVTRYFMTITEAAQLVIQAGSMSKSCDVFVLDMGNEIKIKDLINRIVNLSGLSVKDRENPDGDIEIKVIGLRPGEKLYEELLLGDNPQPTEHEKIKKAQDPFIPLNKLNKDLDILKSLSIKNNALEVKEMLKKMVNTYNSDYDVVDYIYTEKDFK